MICAMEEFSTGPAEMVGLADSRNQKKKQSEWCPLQQHAALTLQSLH